MKNGFNGINVKLMARWDQVDTAIIVMNAEDFPFVLRSYLLPVPIQKRRIASVATSVATGYWNNGSGRIR